jgi:hypothetical protein
VLGTKKTGEGGNREREEREDARNPKVSFSLSLSRFCFLVSLFLSSKGYHRFRALESRCRW